MPIKAFLSYSTRDKRLAGELRDLLSTAGIDLFLAHHTLAPSTEWRQEIKRQIASREVFVLLLTKNFHSSKWADQEVGMAIAQRKTILPLQFPVRPYGFTSDYQAISVTDVEESFWELIAGILSRHPKERGSIRRRLVSALCGSTSFHAARNSLLVLQHNFFPLTRKEKAKILEASKVNDQIGGFGEVTGFISKLKKELESKKNSSGTAREKIGEFVDYWRQFETRLREQLPPREGKLAYDWKRGFLDTKGPEARTLFDSLMEFRGHLVHGSRDFRVADIEEAVSRVRKLSEITGIPID